MDNARNIQLKTLRIKELLRAMEAAEPDVPEKSENVLIGLVKFRLDKVDKFASGGLFEELTHKS